jgi:hypothetical protein
MDEAGLLAGAFEIVKDQEKKLMQTYLVKTTRNGHKSFNT